MGTRAAPFWFENKLASAETILHIGLALIALEALRLGFRIAVLHFLLLRRQFLLGFGSILRQRRRAQRKHRQHCHDQ